MSDDNQFFSLEQNVSWKDSRDNVVKKRDNMRFAGELLELNTFLFECKRVFFSYYYFLVGWCFG